MPLRTRAVSGPLPIYQIEIDRSRLNEMAADVRRSFLLFGHISNEINTLYRLLIFSMREEAEPTMKLFAECRAMSIARLLIGTTHEGFLAVQKHVLGQRFGQHYLPHMDEDGQAALKAVRKELSNTKVMAAIRNNFAFHFPTSDQIDNAYSRLPSEIDLSIYSGRPRHSSLYMASLVFMTQGMLDCVDDPEDKLSHVEAMELIMDDAIAKSTVLNDFIEALLSTIVDRENLSSTEKARAVLTIDGYESMKSFRIPPLMRS